jgi:hypothetical protein
MSRFTPTAATPIGEKHPADVIGAAIMVGGIEVSGIATS